MKSDAQLKQDVLQELDWEPAINAAHVGVMVNDGVVTLTGHLDTFAEKHAIERVVQRVQGVKAIAIELDVKLAPGHRRSDAEIAEAAEAALAWHALVPDEQIHLKVENGWVTLSGQVDWQFQRVAAEKAVRPLTGVVGVSNAIALKPQTTPADVSQRIREALLRHAEREARHIDVLVDGAVVTLRGQVDSWHERSAVGGAAWSVPGVTRVVNDLLVRS
jgi:osmotically-inducible protein OsmY